MCVIRVDGKNHFTIAPHPGGHFTHAPARCDSIFGMVESGWERTEQGYVLTGSIPCNTTAEVILPDGNHVTVPPGLHRLTRADHASPV